MSSLYLHTLLCFLCVQDAEDFSSVAFQKEEMLAAFQRSAKPVLNRIWEEFPFVTNQKGCNTFRYHYLPVLNVVVKYANSLFCNKGTIYKLHHMLQKSKNTFTYYVFLLHNHRKRGQDRSEDQRSNLILPPTVIRTWNKSLNFSANQFPLLSDREDVKCSTCLTKLLWNLNTFPGITQWVSKLSE